MKKREIYQYLKEHQVLHSIIEDVDQFVIEAAFFIEDVFKIRLEDAEITPNNMGSHEALETFVRAKLQLEETCAESAE